MDTNVVRSIKPHAYGGVVREVGELYEMEERFVLPMVLTGNVERIAGDVLPKQDDHPSPPPVSRRYRTRALQAEK